MQLFAGKEVGGVVVGASTGGSGRKKKEPRPITKMDRVGAISFAVLAAIAIGGFLLLVYVSIWLAYPWPVGVIATVVIASIIKRRIKPSPPAFTRELDGQTQTLYTDGQWR